MTAPIELNDAVILMAVRRAVNDAEDACARHRRPGKRGVYDDPDRRADLEAGRIRLAGAMGELSSLRHSMGTAPSRWTYGQRRAASDAARNARRTYRRLYRMLGGKR